jgi:hypothetical protein
MRFSAVSEFDLGISVFIQIAIIWLHIEGQAGDFGVHALRKVCNVVKAVTLRHPDILEAERLGERNEFFRAVQVKRPAIC